MASIRQYYMDCLAIPMKYKSDGSHKSLVGSIMTFKLLSICISAKILVLGLGVRLVARELYIGGGFIEQTNELDGLVIEYTRWISSLRE